MNSSEERVHWACTRCMSVFTTTVDSRRCFIYRNVHDVDHRMKLKSHVPNKYGRRASVYPGSSSPPCFVHFLFSGVHQFTVTLTVSTGSDGLRHNPGPGWTHRAEIPGGHYSARPVILSSNQRHHTWLLTSYMHPAQNAFQDRRSIGLKSFSFESCFWFSLFIGSQR
jgi:hypothetical protein